MSSEHSNLTNVHDALKAASLESKNQKKPMVSSSFKIEEDVKEEVQKICERNGTDMSTFLRKCCLGLVNDYRA